MNRIFSKNLFSDTKCNFEYEIVREDLLSSQLTKGFRIALLLLWTTLYADGYSESKFGL